MDDDQELGLAMRCLLLACISEVVEGEGIGGTFGGGVGARPSSGVVRPEGGLLLLWLLLLKDDDEDGLRELLGLVGVDGADDDVGNGCCGGCGSSCSCSCCCCC